MPGGALGGALGSAGGGAANSGSRNAYYNIALMAGLNALATLTQPGPKRPGRDSVKMNLADAAQVWPYIAGTVKMYPHLIWYGDYLATKIKNDVGIDDIAIGAALGAAAGFASPTAAAIGAVVGAMGAGLGAIRTSSYRHHLGLAYGICHGPISRIRTIWIDDKEVYTSSSDNAGNSVLIDKKKLWGGDHELGGFYGRCDIVRGDFWPTQIVNPYLASQVTGIEAFSGKALFVIQGPSGFEDDGDFSGYFAATPSENPIVRPMALEVCVWPDNLGVTAYKKCGSDSLDANPAEVAYQWITNTVYGGRLPASRVDLASFQSGAQTHFNEGLGCSLEFNREYDVEAALDDIQSMASVGIHGSFQSGTIKYKPIRRTYSIASLPILRHGQDSSVSTKSQFNVLEIESHELGTWKGTINDLRLEYRNRSNKYQVEKQPAFDSANRAIQGRTVTFNQQFPGVGHPSTAALVATREMRALSFPRPPFVVYVNREAGWDTTNSRYIEPGDVRKLISHKYNWTKIVRILEVGIGKEDDSRIRLKCVEDVFGVGAAAFANAGGGGFTYPLDPAEITSYLVQDAPYAITRDDDPRALVFAHKPNNAQIKYDVQVSTDLGTSYTEEASDASFAIKGTITQAVERLTAVKLTSLTFTPASTFEAVALASASTTQISNEFENLIYWEDSGEWGAVETITNNGDGTYTLGNIWRAVGPFDSVPAPHTAGATVWFFSARRALSGEHAAATALRLKLISNAPGGDYSSATAISHTTAARALKPLPVRGLTINGSYLTEVVTSGDITIAWATTNRTTETTVKTQTEAGVTAETNTEYEIKIFGEAGTLLRTVTQSGATYTYTNATEISDAGSLQDQLLFLITTIRDTTVRSHQTYVRRVLRTSAEVGCIVTVNGDNVTHNSDLVVAGCQVTVNGVYVTVNGAQVWVNP